MTPERRSNLIAFALRRLARAARDRADAAAQDKKGVWFKPGDFERFLNDA